VTKLWAEYDKFGDTSGTTNWDYNINVGVTVFVTDTANNSFASQNFHFKTETDIEHGNARKNLPKSFTVKNTEETSKFKGGGVTPYFVSIEFDDTEDIPEAMKATEMIFNAKDGGVTPYFGPMVGNARIIPPLNIPGVAGVGTPLNLWPHRTFPSGITLFISTPEDYDVSDLNIYGYNGAGWSLVLDSAGNIQPAGEGWLIEGWNNGLSKNTISNDSLSGITIWVYHFSGFIAGIGSVPSDGSSDALGSAGNINGTPATGGLSFWSKGGDGGDGCFINTLMK
jgi:hypothetical protein